MQHQGTSSATVAATPSRTSWMLPNGFGSIELPPENPALPQHCGHVSRIQHFLRPGLDVYTFEAVFNCPLTMTYEVLTEEPYLWLAVNLTGRCEFRHGKTITGAGASGDSHLGLLRDPATTIVYPGTAQKGAGMAISPARLDDMLRGRRPCRRIDEFIEGRFDPSVASSPGGPALHRIAHEMRENPYHGVMASVFLEAKAYELLAELLRQLADDRHPADNDRRRRLALAARDIMMADLANPLRIEDVARQLGISQRRLNEAFQEVFGASPLQSLVKWRLDLARQLLATREVSVKQVAHQLGYSHVSNFSLAFSRRFGHPPSLASR